MNTSNSPFPEHSHFITLDHAITMTGTYRNNRELILDAGYQGQNILALSETFNREAFDHLLATEGCAGLRIYYGMDAGLKVHAVIVAVNSLNEDLLPATSIASNLNSDDEVIVEEGQRCPPICPDPSPLNS